jgi:UDP-N-acetyl-D-glucosamine dehydrogenase
MSTLSAQLLDRIEKRSARVGVVGLGYVGLPLVVEFAHCGFDAIGIDLDATKVAAINSGTSYIPDTPSAHVKALTAAGRLRATTDFAVISTLDTVNICVPTPLRKTKDPDMSYVVSAVQAVADHLHPGMLIVLESTTYPGTTEEVVQPILESRGLKAGVDFFLAFSPERVDPGNKSFNTHNVPKIVGGMTETCSTLAQRLYGAAIETVIPVSSPRVAEMVKLLENTFRSVNIGLANEIALMCEKLDIDVWEVVNAAKTKPFGFMPFYPGPGLGGHCIPIDPLYLSWKAKQTGFEPRLIEVAGQINAAMPHAVVDKIAVALNDHKKPLNGSRVLIAGVTYKRDVSDIRESPALDIMGLLKKKGVEVAFVDPFVPRLRKQDWAGDRELAAEPLLPPTFGRFDCVAIVTDHSQFDWAGMVAHARLIVDTRDAIKGRHPHVYRLGAPQVLTALPEEALAAC